MIKAYLKILNNLLTENLLYYVSAFVLIINALVRFNPKIVLNINEQQATILNDIEIIPTGLFTFCDVYLLLFFIIIIYFFLGSDFTNSMEDISLAVGGSKINKFMYRKLYTTLIVYAFLYLVSFINIYTLYKKILPPNVVIIGLTEILFYSFTTNIFIVSLSLVILFLIRNIPISIIIISSCYLVEESLWRCKVTQRMGILGHLYHYYDYLEGERVTIKLLYIIASLILLYIAYRLSSRKKVSLFKYLNI